MRMLFTQTSQANWSLYLGKDIFYRLCMDKDLDRLNGEDLSLLLNLNLTYALGVLIILIGPSLVFVSARDEN